MQLGASRDQGLGPQDVRAACERSEGEPRSSAGDLLDHTRSDRGLLLGRKRRTPLSPEAVSAIVEDARTGEGPKQLVIDAHAVTDEAQLPPCGGESGVVVLVQFGSARQRHSGAVLIAQQQVCLSFRGSHVVGALVIALEYPQHL